MPDSETKTESVIATAKSKSKKRVRGNAVTRLAKATARNVRDKSEELSAALVNRALEGDVSCTKLLLTLSRNALRKNANSGAWQRNSPTRPNGKVTGQRPAPILKTSLTTTNTVRCKFPLQPKSADTLTPKFKGRSVRSGP
jgi:hypothetical protein